MRHIALPAIVLVLLSACGGGGDSGAGTTSAASTSGTTPAVPTFTPPKQGAEHVFAQTLVDNLNNTLHRTLDSTVTAVNPDNSFTVHEEDPSHNRTISGKVDHSLYPTDLHYDGTGAETDFVVTRPSGAVHCTLGQRTSTAPARITVGTSWTASHTQTCDDGTSGAFTDSNSVAALESVTVPAGTFQAYRIQTTTTYTTNGITHTNTTTRWRNADASGPQTIKLLVQYSYSGGTPPDGEPTSLAEELQSYH